MSPIATDTARRIKITAGNLRNNHIYITGHLDFFPSDCVGGARGRDQRGNPIAIELEGLGETIETDIGRDARTGRPRGVFRARAWARQFFTQHELTPGDFVRLERLGERQYRLRVDAPQAPSRTFLEFFAGIGLVRMGLEAGGWRLAFANDIDASKLAMYSTQFADGADHFELADIHTLSAEKIPSATLATASFPCTDLSLAGGREGLRGRQSSSFFGFLRVLEELGDRRPPLVLLENVLGFLTSHGGQDFAEAMHLLNGLGYSVDPFVLDAKWFVPQSRPRLFVVGMMSTTAQRSEWRLVPDSRLRPSLVTGFIADHPEINWCLRDLPEPPLGASKRLVGILDRLPDDAPEWWSRDRQEYLYHQMSPKHKATADSWMAKRVWSYGTVFRRVRLQPDGVKRSMAELRSDGLAGCLRTPKGGSGRQILFKAGYGRYAARLLTPNECAKLMGADGYRIGVPLNQALFGFGDAVCVPAVSWIAENYLNHVLQERAVPLGKQD